MPLDPIDLAAGNPANYRKAHRRRSSTDSATCGARTASGASDRAMSSTWKAGKDKTDTKCRRRFGTPRKARLIRFRTLPPPPPGDKLFGALSPEQVDGTKLLGKTPLDVLLDQLAPVNDGSLPCSNWRKTSSEFDVMFLRTGTSSVTVSGQSLKGAWQRNQPEAVGRFFEFSASDWCEDITAVWKGDFRGAASESIHGARSREPQHLTLSLGASALALRDRELTGVRSEPEAKNLGANVR